MYYCYKHVKLVQSNGTTWSYIFKVRVIHMPYMKYDAIYKSLLGAIESGEYPYGGMLPSEHQLIGKYDCSRNTVRRAIARLAEEGYVQSVHGKGVQVIYQIRAHTQFAIGAIETMKEAAERNGMTLRTELIGFEEKVVDEAFSEKTGFPVGEEVYYLQRLRYLDGRPLILDHNYFLKRVVAGLTPQIASESVYEYMEKTLHETIVTTRRRYTVERETELDARYLDLRGFNCVMVVSSKTFNKDGILFEYTSSRHCPDKFVFYDAAQRKKEGQI